MTDDIELKPCAHCGSMDIRTMIGGNNDTKIMCFSCGISTQWQPEAIEKWNSRA